MNEPTLRKIIEAQVAYFKGDAFQDMCDRLCLQIYPHDYTPVRAGGPKGDTKNDGYCPKAKIFFAAHATKGEKISVTKNKIKSDLEGCLKNYNDVRTWIYLTNDTLTGEIQQFINEQLRPKYSEVVIETWDHKKITEKILTLEEKEIGNLLEINLGVTVHLEDEIENAVHLLNENKPQEALILLERLWERHSHEMTGHQQYRTRANIGHAYDRLDQRQKAAECFLEAKQYDPDNEKARAREALAYLYLGNTQKAHELSGTFLESFPENRLGRAVLVMSAPKEMLFSDIEQLVPTHQRNDLEVAMSLGEAAMSRDQYDIAEKYISQALEEKPEVPRIKEVLGDLLLNRARIAEQAVNDRGPTKEEAKCLEHAKNLFTDALSEYHKQGLVVSTVRTLLKRANVFMGLNDIEKMEEDIEYAHKLAPSDTEVVFRYAGLKIKEADWNAAIELLETLIDKEHSCAIEHCLSECLDKRNAEGDKNRAVQLLKSRLNDLSEEMPEIRAIYLTMLIDLNRQTEGLEASLKILESLPENTISDELATVLRGEAIRLSGNQSLAADVAKEILSIINPDTDTQDRRRIARFLQAVGMYKEGLEIWKTIVRPEYIGRDTYCLMQCADQCEDIRFIIEFNENLRANDLWERKLFELELAYREKYNDDKGAKAVLEKFLENPHDQSYVSYARVRLSFIGIRTGQKNLIETDPLKLPSVTEVQPHIGKAVATIFRYGPDPIKGVEYAYELLRLNWNSQDAHMAMMEQMFAPFGPTVKIEEPEFAAPGVAVHYQENDTKDLRWHIIEDSIVIKPESIREEFSPEHPYSKEMRGKKVGENFYLDSGGLQKRTAIIKQLVNKYVYRFNECLNEFESRFPGQSTVQRIIVKHEGEKIDLSPFYQFVERESKAVKKIEDLYKDQFVPIYMVANMKGKHVLEALQHIGNATNLRIKCCKGTDEDEETAEVALKESENLVLDAVTLSTIYFLKAYDLFTRIPRQLFVSEGTIDEFQTILRNFDNPERMAGSYTANGFIAWKSEEREETRKGLQELIAQINDHCKIESGLIIGNLPGDRRARLLEIFGQSGVESLMLAARPGYVLWTDDLATSEIAQIEFGCRRIWTQKTVDYFCEEGVFRPEFRDELTMSLIHMRYYYTKPTVGALLKAVEKTHGDIEKSPLSQALDWFYDSNVKIEGKHYIGAIFIKNIWQDRHLDSVCQAITIKVFEHLAKIPKGHEGIMFWLNNIDNIFGVDVINAVKVKRIIEAWLNGGKGTRIIIP